MLSLQDNRRYFLYQAIADMRRSFDGLGGIVRQQMEMNVLAGDVDIFINKRRNLLDQVTQLTFELREMKRLLFGRKSERYVPDPSTIPGQLDLQLAMEEAAQPPIITEEVKVVTKVVPAQKPTGRQPLPVGLS